MSVKGMLPLSECWNDYLKERYFVYDLFFPIIGAVIEGRQKGFVFADDLSDPNVFLIIHEFGFAQCFVVGEQNGWEHRIAKFILKDKLEGIISKIRLYAVDGKLASLLDAENVSRSDRMRWNYSQEYIEKTRLPRGYSISEIDSSHIKQIDSQLNIGLSTRFWKSREDYLQYGLGVVCHDEDNNPVSICYSAAVSNGNVEIDILTLPGHRGKGLAQAVAEKFITKCFKKGICPQWDCYINNEPSMNLVATLGFEKTTVYRFYIVYF